jgi:hypothetical protein
MNVTLNGSKEERNVGNQDGDQEIKMSLENKITELLKDLELSLRDAGKFDRGNASAGVRVRKDLMSAAKQIKEIRQFVLDEKKSRKES